MKNSIVNIIIGILLIFSSLFFLLSIIEVREQKAGEQRMEKLHQALVTEIPFQFNDVMARLTPAVSSGNSLAAHKVDAPYAALIILNTGVCTACVLEVHDLIDALSTFEEVKIDPILVVLESDSSKATTFLRKTMFNTPSYWGQNMSINRLTYLADEFPPVEQILALVDRNGNRVVYRHIIPSAVTSLAYKQTLLEEMLSYL